MVHKERAATVLETPRGPKQPTNQESRMPLSADATAFPFVQYAPETIYGPATGSVYFITVGDPYGTHVKIGFTRGDPRQRLKDLQTGCPFRLSLLGSVPGCMTMEAELHGVLDEYRVSGEWFIFDGYAEIVIDGILTHHERAALA
jgi:hypothetical protein